MIEPNDEYQEAGFYGDSGSMQGEVADVADVADVAQRAKDGALSALDQGKEYVRNNPVPAVLAALGLGLVLGAIAARCTCEDEKDIADDKIDELKSLVSALSDKVTSAASDQYSSASSALGSALKSAKKRFKLS